MIDLRFRPIDKPIKPPGRYQARRWDLDWTGNRAKDYIEKHGARVA